MYIRNMAVFKLIPFLCTYVYSYMFSTVHPPRDRQTPRYVEMLEVLTLGTLTLHTKIEVKMNNIHTHS